MKTTEHKEQFIQLRAKGKSFDKIAAEMNVSKPTLIEWQRQFRAEISNMQFIEYQSLIEQFQHSKKQVIERLCKEIERINQEIEKRDLSELTIKDLYSLKTAIEAKLHNELRNIQLNTGEKENPTMMDFTGKDILINLNEFY
jgi:transposase